VPGGWCLRRRFHDVYSIPDGEQLEEPARYSHEFLVPDGQVGEAWLWWSEGPLDMLLTDSVDDLVACARPVAPGLPWEG
jgi:hypothetical protein